MLVEYRVDELATASVEIRDVGSQLVRSLPSHVIEPSTVPLSGGSTLTQLSVGFRFRGGYSYSLANIGATLFVHDVRDPANVIEVAQLALPMPTQALSLEIVGSKLYVSGEDRLVLLDVSNPTLPIVLSTASAKVLTQLAGSADGRMLFGSTRESDFNDTRNTLAVYNLVGPEPRLISLTRIEGVIAKFILHGNLRASRRKHSFV